MYGTMPLTLTVWLYSDTNKKKLNALGLVRRTKTSVHKIVNVCLQYLSSLLFFRKYDIRTGSIVRPFTLSYITRLAIR